MAAAKSKAAKAKQAIKSKKAAKSAKAKAEPKVQEPEEAVLTPDDLRAIKDSGEALDFATEDGQKVTLGFDVDEKRFYLLVEETSDELLYFTEPEATLWALKHDVEAGCPLSAADRESFRLTPEEIKTAQTDKQPDWTPNAEPKQRKVAKKGAKAKAAKATPEANEKAEKAAPKKAAVKKAAKSKAVAPKTVTASPKKVAKAKAKAEAVA